jgi:hypothetical protein
MVKKEGTHLESLMVVRERGLMGTWAKFRSSCVAALHPRTAVLGWVEGWAGVVGERYRIWRGRGRALLDLEGLWESTTGFGVVVRERVAGERVVGEHYWIWTGWDPFGVGAHHMIFLQKVFHCLVSTQIWSAHPNWAISGTPNADSFRPLFG